MDEAMVRELAERVEDHHLDFKEGLYSSNEELAKDLMAIANLLLPGSKGHILVGVRQRPDDTGEIVGVELGDDRDSNYQQKVHGKLNRVPRFTFLPLQLPEGDVGVFEITGIGDRPYFPLADAGKMKKNVALKRQGSSTATASPDEIREWVLEDRVERNERHSALRELAVAEADLDVEVKRIESRSIELTRAYKLLLGGGPQHYTSAIEEKVRVARELLDETKIKEDKPHEASLDSVKSQHIKVARALTQVRAVREDLEREQASVEGQCAANREAEIAKRRWPMS